MDDDWLAGEQKRAVLRNVAAYRRLCHQVRRKATGGLIFGAFMLGIWYFLLPERGALGKYGPLGLIYLGLAGLEFTVALWNKLRPSAEGVLMDGLVLCVFGASTLARQYLVWQNGMAPSVVLALLGAFWVWSGVSHARGYAGLRRAFAIRPTADHLRWFDELLREVRDADPTDDPAALDLPTRPPTRGKLLGDTAIFLQAGSDDPVIAARTDVEIERQPARSADRDPVGYLVIEGADFGSFPLDPDNWRNYERWKIEGGEPPPPMPVRRAVDPE
jgi:hypothetical protein